MKRNPDNKTQTENKMVAITEAKNDDGKPRKWSNKAYRNTTSEQKTDNQTWKANKLVS